MIQFLQKYKTALGKSFFLIAGVMLGLSLWYRFAQIPHLTEMEAFIHMWKWYTITGVFSILSVALLWDE